MYNKGMGTTTISRVLEVSAGKVIYFVKKNIGLRSCKQAAKKFQCDEKFFDVIDTEEKAYWLGFIYADGYVSKQKYGKKVGITLSENDIDHLEKFKESIKFEGPIHTFQPKENATNYTKNPYSRILISSDHMFDALVKHGVVEHKTNILHAPKIDANLQAAFIRGYLDGDGCITRYVAKHNCMSYAVRILGTENLLDYIKEFIESNNVAKIRRYYQRRPGQKVRSLEFAGNYQVRKFLDLIYQDAHIYLDRKHNRYIDLCNLLNSRAARKRAA